MVYRSEGSLYEERYYNCILCIWHWGSIAFRKSFFYCNPLIIGV